MPDIVTAYKHITSLHFTACCCTMRRRLTYSKEQLLVDNLLNKRVDNVF